MTDTKEQAKEEIISGAGEIFSRFGYRKTTVAEIAQRVNKAKSSIFHYFNSKEEIFLAVLKKEGQELTRIFNEVIEQEQTVKSKLRAYFMLRFETLPSIVNFYNALNDAELEHFDFVKDMRNHHLERTINMIGRILSDGVANDIFEIKDVSLVAKAIVTAFKGFELVYREQRRPSDLNSQVTPEVERQIDCLLEILFRGLTKG
jgi:AcrR family transcriptional regulator